MRTQCASHFEEGSLTRYSVSVRAYSAEEAFKKEVCNIEVLEGKFAKIARTLKSLRRIDRYTRASRTMYNLNRWINVRGDVFGAAFSSGLAAYLVYGTGTTDKPGSAANIGFSLNMAGMSLHFPPFHSPNPPQLASAASFCGGFGH